MLAKTEEFWKDKGLKPRLRLFVSVDLVGSTAFKQETIEFGGPPSLGPPWADAILRFYSDFADVLARKVREFNDVAQRDSYPQVGLFEFWKSNGDELLFSVELDCDKAATRAMIVWLRTLRNYRARHVGGKDQRLDVKSTAWVAGFPVLNTEVIFDDRKPSNPVASESVLVRQYELRREFHSRGARARATLGLRRDFIGPSIDTGFRLCGWCTPRKLFISAELAYILAVERPQGFEEIDDDFTDAVALRRHPPEEIGDVRINFEGTEELRGVLGGRRYPRLWASLDDLTKLEEAELKLLGRSAESSTDGRRSREVNRSDLETYCLAFFREHRNWMFRPFIYGSTGALSLDADISFKRSYAKKLQGMYELVRKDAKKETDDKKSLEARDSRPVDAQLLSTIGRALLDALAEAGRSEGSAEKGEPGTPGDQALPPPQD